MQIYYTVNLREFFKKINLDVYIHDFCKENSHPVIYFLRTACGLNVQYCLKKLCNLWNDLVDLY